MTISTPRTEIAGPAAPRARSPARGRRVFVRLACGAAPAPTGRAALRRRGFTLTEVIVAATLSTLVLAGVLSAFLMIGRTGFVASSYSEMETQARRGLEIFGTDVRKAADIRWNSSQSVTLSVATATSATTLVTYAYDNDPSSGTHGCFYRVLGGADSTLPRRVLVRDVSPDFTFERFKLEVDGAIDHAATTDLETKTLQVTFRAARAAVTTPGASQSALSARYVLRNKRVAN